MRIAKEASNKAPRSRSGKASSDASPASRSNSLHGLHQTLGNQGMQRLLRSGAIQAKLRVGAPNDAHEQEADRVADRVMRGAGPGPQLSCACGGGCPRCQEKFSLQAKRLPGPSSPQLPPLVNEVLSSPGEPLEPAARHFMEPRLGRELGQVRIHRDERAAESARSVNARAYTVGTHVVFGAGEYAPSGDAGRRLLAHEMAHVVQQDRSGTLAVQRREGNYPNTEYQSAGFPYYVLKPKQLNVKGVFTAAVLDEISSTYFNADPVCAPADIPFRPSKRVMCGPPRRRARQAELIVKLLESSPEFLDIAAKLDAFYAVENNPGFRIFGGRAGTKFVPTGVPYKASSADEATTEDLDVVMLDYGVNPRMLDRDPSQAASEDEQIAVAFVDALVHEAVHAFRRVSKLTKGGLKGSIEEELATRKKSSDILKEIQGGSSEKGIKQQAEGYIQDIGADALTLKQVALSMVSGDKITYLESYFIESAIREFFEKYSSTKRDSIPELAGLDHPSAVASGDADEHVGELQSLIARHSDPREILIDRDVGMTGVVPPLKVKTLPPLSPVLNAHDVFRLTVLLAQTGTLKDLVKEATNVKKFSPAGLAVFYHVLLLKASLIKARLKQEHQDAGLDPASKDHEKLCNELARKFLDETRPYDKLK